MSIFKVRISLAPLLTVIASLLWTQAPASQVQLVSRPSPSSPSTSGGGDSYLPIVTSDGRFVLFASTADNLDQLGTNGHGSSAFPVRLNIFLKDRTNGSTILISVNAAGIGGGNGDSLPIGLSTNGQYALFESSASDLVTGDTNQARDIFVRDVLLGKTILVSAAVDGGFADKSSYSSVMTPDGRYVAFASTASNLVSGDTNGISDIYVRDLASNVTTLVSVGAKTTPSLS